MLEVRNLTKRFGNRTVIEDLCFSIRRGERLCLFAPSGAGKTTLIRILTGLDRRFTGMFHLDTDRKATLFQEPGLLWYKTVEENILYPFAVRRVSVDRAVRNRYAEWMEMTGLKGFENHYPHEISGGMKHKAAIVRGFLPEPDLILMDEPFKSIDVIAKWRIIEHVKREYPDLSGILVTHNLDEIPLISQTVLLFPERRLAEGRTISIAEDTGFGNLSRAIHDVVRNTIRDFD